MAAWNSFSYICTRAFHSFRSFAQCRAASTVIPLLAKATFRRSIQPNLGLPGTRPILTSAINTLLAIRYSSILSTFPNHLNTLWSTLLANSFSIPANFSKPGFYLRSTFDTKEVEHYTSYPMKTKVSTYNPTYNEILRKSWQHILFDDNKNLNHKGDVILCNQATQRVTNRKFLSIIVDQHLNWKDHISMVLHKISNSCGIISHIQNTLAIKSKKFIIIVWYTLSYLLYECLVLYLSN